MSFILGMIFAFILNHFYNNFRSAVLQEQLNKEWERRKQLFWEAMQEEWIK
jgi:hypothetical protein